MDEGSDGAAQASGQWLRLAAAQSGNASGPSLFRFGAMSLFRNVPRIRSAREGLNSEQKNWFFIVEFYFRRACVDHTQIPIKFLRTRIAIAEEIIETIANTRLGRPLFTAVRSMSCIRRPTTPATVLFAIRR